MIYLDVPSFLRSPVVREKTELRNYDFAVIGAPWEGALTWGGRTGCQFAPAAIREASARYGGYLPDRGIDILESMRLCDYGDVDVKLGDTEVTFQRISEKISDILFSGARPITFGGDHSIAYPIVKAIAESGGKKIGIVHLDAHFDNLNDYEGDRYARCCPLRRISELASVPNNNIVHVGIRGPRNTSEGEEYAKQIGASVYTIRDVRQDGIDRVIKSAIAAAFKGTDGIYMTVCMDVMDAAYAPGAAKDPMGLSSYEMLQMAFEIGKAGLIGLDVVEVYPPADLNNMTSHLAVWIALYALAGVASAGIKKNTNR
jgi:agmatinase